MIQTSFKKAIAGITLVCFMGVSIFLMPSRVYAAGGFEQFPTEDEGGFKFIDENGDGIFDGADTDGDGKIDLRDFNGDGKFDPTDVISWVSEQRECAVDLGNLQKNLEKISGYLQAAGTIVAIAGWTGVGAVIGVAIAVIGFILSLFGGTSIEELYADKELKCDPRARVQAADLFIEMTARIMYFIAHAGPNEPGTRGGTTWISDWRHFVQKQQDRGRNLFRYQIYDAALGKNAKICPYLADTIAQVFDAEDNTITFNGNANEFLRLNSDQDFNTRNACSLAEDFNLEEYLNSDTVDWDTFQKLLEPQNNALGLLFNSLEEANLQTTAEEAFNREDAVANLGFRGVRDPEKDVVTPGSVLAQIGATTITKQLDWLISADEIGEVVFDGMRIVLPLLYGLDNAKLP